MNLIIIMFLSCKGTPADMFLQQSEVRIAQPRISSTNTIIDSFVTVKANLDLIGTTIYYSSNGTEPTIASEKYTAPFKVTEASTYKFRAYNREWKPSDISTISFYKKGKVPDEIIWHSKFQTKYKGKGELTLINQNKASLPFSNPEWMGFDTVVNAQVIFKELTMIKSIDIGFLNDPQSWIFPPSEITIYLNDDHTIENKIKVKLEENLSELPAESRTLNIKIGRVVKSIQLEITNLQSIPNWHDGSGQMAWLFMDEWIFN